MQISSERFRGPRGARARRRAAGVAGAAMPRAAWLAAAALLAWTTVPAGAVAQVRHGGHVHGEPEYEERGREGDGDRYRRSRVQLGGGLAVAVPQGEFADFVDDGYGFGVHAVFGLDPSNAVGLRFDAGLITYGSERFTTPLLPSTGRVLVDVKTRNNIGILSVGPQFQAPDGPIRPYVNGFVGLGYFFTESSVGGSSNFDFQDFASTINFDDVSFAYGLGGGLGLRLSRGRTPVYLDFDVQYRRHGKTEYLREGSVIDDGFGGLIIEPIFSDADFTLFQVGVSVGL